MKEIVNTENAPNAIGPYSQANRIDDFIFVSGQLPINPLTGELSGNNVKDQARQSLENVKSILSKAGTDITRVVKTTVFLQNMDDFADMNQMYGQYFTDNFPARTTVEVSRLPKDAKVEIEVIAHL